MHVQCMLSQVSLEVVITPEQFTTHSVICRDAPILAENFLENYIGKSKEQNAGKIGGKLEKMGTKEWKLGTFCMIKIEIL